LGAGDAAYRTGLNLSGRTAVDTVPYGCYYRATWERLGGYNEKLWTNEDYEFNYRVRQHGAKVILDPAIRCNYMARATLRGLAAQYARYGWWKAKMLREHPESIRMRQAIPVGFVAALLALALASPMMWIARPALALLLLVYGGALGAATFQLRSMTRHAAVMFWLPLVFATVHCCWGGGMLVHFFTLGRWPSWSPRDPSAW
jgi:succinoglycan biosynthesis protein ExoA